MKNNIALILDDNMLSASRIKAALERLKYSPLWIQSIEQLPDHEQTESVTLAVLNYNISNTEILRATRELRKMFPLMPILGFVSHGQIPSMREAAEEAGCSQLVANSVISRNLPQLIERISASKLNEDVL